jgi:hypothetical protein
MQADLNTKCSDVTMIHAGTNSIRHGISATVIMRDITDLTDCTIKQVPKTKIVISAVLYRRNISDCLMVDGNCQTGKSDLAKDGIHLNRG